MPTYEITSPDGQTFEVTAPEGASKDQVLTYAKLQFSGIKKPEPAKRTLAAEDTPGFGQTMLIGAGRTFDRLGKGMQQLYYGATGDEKAQADLKRRADEEDALYAPLKEARPWATGIGESLPSMAIPGGGAASLGANALRMAVAGAVPGVLEYGSAEERAKRGAIGAAAGAAVPLVGAAAKTAWSAAQPFFATGRETIAGRVLNAAAGEAAPAVRQRLANAAELVPGSAPTAAQVSESGGIAALERAMSSANPEAYTQRAMSQSSARLNALRGIAGDETQLANAVARRSSVAGAAYKRAEEAGVDGGMADAMAPQIASLLERDEIKAAVAEARSLARSEGINLEDGLGNVQGLQYLKQALDDRIAELPPKAANKFRVWSKTSNELKSVLDEIVPDLRQADAVYARMSREPNRMQVGQALLDRVQPALADHGALGRESGASFANALRSGDQVARRATNFPGATLEGVMGPQNMGTLNAVAADLGRKANAQDLGRGVGSNTFQNFAMQNIAEQSGIPRITGGLLGVPGLSHVTTWGYRATDQKVRDALADAMLDPRKAADLMSRADQKWLADNPALRRSLEQVALRTPASLLSVTLAPFASQ